MKFKRPSIISKGSLDRMLKAAGEAWDNKKFPEAVELLERASSLNPSNTGILLYLGRLHGLRYNYRDAERCLERAVQVTQDKTEILAAAGLQCRDFGNFAMAASYYLRATSQSNASPALFVEMAKIYERLRRVEEAAGMLDRALHMDSHHLEALLTRARLERQAGRLETAEQVIRSCEAKANPDVWINAQTWYELGSILDRQEKYDEAMNAFLKAKALLKPQSGRFLYELKVVRQRIKLMQENLTSEMLQRWFAAGSSLTPPRRIALLCGHPRSGTTLLEQVLDSHPDIISAEETEIFLNEAYSQLANSLPNTPMLPVLESATIDTLQHARTNFSRSAELFLGQSVGNRLLIDKNPSLTFLIPALIRIFPEIKLLVALRDPRDVVLSCFMQPMPLSQVSSAYLSIEDTVGEYAAMMSLWQDLKPRIDGRYLQVHYEGMVDDLATVARQTLSFLGVPWNENVLGFDEHARKKLVRSPTYADVAQPIYKRARGRWRNYQKYLEPHLERLTPFAESFGYD
jgi:tetratricopeptide (TPR) repeat protein